MNQIGNMPLWVVVAIWTLQRMNRPCLVGVDVKGAHMMLNEIFSSLPAFPKGRFGIWLQGRVCEWIYSERSMLDALGRLGVFAVGQVEKD